MDKELVNKLTEEFIKSNIKDVNNHPYFDLESLFTPTLKNYLFNVIDNIGWVSSSKYGDEAHNSFWKTLTMIKDLDYLQKAKDLGVNSDQTKQEYAELEDRIMRIKGFEQIYGTQLLITLNDIYILPIKDLKEVDELRAKVGWSSLKEYKKHLEEKYSKSVRLLAIKDRWKLD